MYTIRSERQLVEQLDYNLMLRWLVGLGVDDPVWHHSAFTTNRKRVHNYGTLRVFFDKVVLPAGVSGYPTTTSAWMAA